VPILEHVYRSRPPSASSVIPLYLAHPAPRPSLLYLPGASPPVTVFSIAHSNLLLLSPSDVDTEPLLVLEFLHRVIDVLEEFLGAPLLSTKLQANYDVVSQLLTEMCDAGLVCNTESNVLQESVEVPGWVDKLLGGVGLSGSVYLSDGFAYVHIQLMTVVLICFYQDLIARTGTIQSVETIVIPLGQCGFRSGNTMATAGRAPHLE
jgi:hypothetical protein